MKYPVSEIVKIFVTIEKGVIYDAKFQTYGSVPTIAATSKVTSDLIGRTLEEADKITEVDVLSLIGGELPKSKEYIPSLMIEVIKDMIFEYNKNK